MITRKILLLGEMGVGKTSIARRLAFDKFGDSYKATIGVDLYRYDVDPSPTDQPFQFIVWDTDGSYGEGIFRQFYASQAQAAMMICDVDRPSTLETMVRLGEQFAATLPGRYFAHIVNKLDLVDYAPAHDIVSRLQATKVPLFTTSAKTGHEVREAFHAAAGSIVRLEA